MDQTPGALVYHDPALPPMRLTGLAWHAEDRQFCRLPVRSHGVLNEDLRRLSWQTSGVTARFMTDSKRLHVRYTLSGWRYNPHMTATGHSGIEVYVGSGARKRLARISAPEENSLEQGLEMGLSGRLQEVTVYFPLCNGVRDMRVGLEPGARIEPPPAFSYNKPVLFYGSSITQGSCASRPGNAYPSIISRWLDVEIINLGFAGAAKAEPEMAGLIAELDVGAFVMDYDHNAPDGDYLARTHEPFYRTIRDAHPDWPVVFITKPNFTFSDPDDCARREAVFKTYCAARDRGERVQFVDGAALYGALDRDLCTTDGGHPNDLGLLRMAQGIAPAVAMALGR